MTAPKQATRDAKLDELHEKSETRYPEAFDGELPGKQFDLLAAHQSGLNIGFEAGHALAMKQAEEILVYALKNIELILHGEELQFCLSALSEWAEVTK